ncbi:hypothetical protein DDF84_028935 [Cupriavidus metallidurans]|uniref:Uncharacterized protein n=1 Tax=Cupriavidus metallidurans TaxID=119219 RepID=A0A482IXA3_9BURK|nr:hypothetical protein DDF84_028935 [Cupriavidus metallidurans]
MHVGVQDAARRCRLYCPSFNNWRFLISKYENRAMLFQTYVPLYADSYLAQMGGMDETFHIL